MNLLTEPIIQSYIYSETYNSIGGNQPVGGLPLSDILERTPEQHGGKKDKPNERHKSLAVPVGLIFMEKPSSQPTVEYKYTSKHTTPHCEVVSDEMFDRLLHLASAKPKYRSRNTRGKTSRVVRLMATKKLLPKTSGKK